MKPLEIFDAYGVSYASDRSPKEYCNWDGQQFNIAGVRADGLLHEISHWVISDKKNLPDFGIGPGPDTTSAAYRAAYSKKNMEPKYNNGDLDETRACVLEFIFGVICGFSALRYMQDRFFVKSGSMVWDMGTGSAEQSFMEDIDWLKDKKIIDKNWVPYQLKKLLSKEHLKRIKEFRSLVKTIR